MQKANSDDKDKAGASAMRINAAFDGKKIAKKRRNQRQQRLRRAMTNAPRIETRIRKQDARWILGGIFFMLSVGAGFMVGSQCGNIIGLLTFILFAVVGAMLHRLVTRFDENKIMDRTTRNWHKRILADAENSLGRKLSDTETRLITSRGGGMALEMIHDTIRAGTKEEVVSYLNSESGKTSNQTL